MTPAPAIEVTLVVAAGLIVGLALTYAVHSTIVLAGAAFIARLGRLAPVDEARLWRAAVVLPFVTALVHVLGWSGLSPARWALADMAPQFLIDWRSGVVGRRVGAVNGCPTRTIGG